MNKTLFWDIVFLAFCIAAGIVGIIMYDIYFLSGISFGMVTTRAIQSVIKDVKVGNK